MFQRIGAAAFKKDLTNTIRLLDALGNPHERFPKVHIAGTNGKGTTAHMLSAVLQKAGYRTGLYTSPHYRDFRERIKVDGNYIPEEEVVAFVADYQGLFEMVSPSFFEITVAMAFWYFDRAQVDIAVVEVGMGGRLDSTNVILPLLSVITNISFDHMEFLGDTLPKIAGEKAGIIKPEIPVVVGETHPETAPVFQLRARELACPLVFADQELTVELLDQGLTHTQFKVSDTEGRVLHPALRVQGRGPFLSKNLTTALMVLEVLPEPWRLDWAIRASAFQDFHERTRYQGRWQILQTSPLVITDSAHNEAGVRSVIQALLDSAEADLHIVWGMVKDKDRGDILSLLPRRAHYYFCRPNVPRGLDASVLAREAQEMELRGRTYQSVSAAYEAARKAAEAGDLVFIGGSTFVVAEVVPEPKKAAGG